MKLRIFFNYGTVVLLIGVKSYYVNKKSLRLIIDFYNNDTQSYSLYCIKYVDCVV